MSEKVVKKYYYYLITCKNDFPILVNEFKISFYETYENMPKKYQGIILSDAYWNLNKFYKHGEELIYFCKEEDPVAAMINFWGAYMYSVPGEGKG